MLEQPGRRILLRGLARKLLQIKPDLVVCHGEYTFNAFELALLNVFLKFRLVVDSHIHYTEEFVSTPSLTTRILLSLFRVFVWRNPRVTLVAVTKQTREYLEKEYRIPGDRITIIPLGADTDRFSPDERIRAEMRDRYGIKDDEVLIVYTGKIIASKDPGLIIEGAKELLNSRKVKILFVGNIGREYSEKFNSLLRLFPKNILQINSVPNEEIAKFYQMSDIGIWPKEASMSCVDAMSCGLPIIISSYLTDRLKFNNGIGIEESNLQELRDAIHRLANDRSLMKSMGARGREFAESELSWAKISEQFVDLAFDHVGKTN